MSVNQTTQDLLNKGRFTKIKGWMHYKEVYAGMVDWAKDGYCFVEIGAWKGKSTFFMAACIAGSGKQIRFDVVDTWKGSTDDQQLNDADLKEGRLFEVFMKNTELVKEFINPIQMDSALAADLYEDETLDFVWIDGDHSYEGVKSDIAKWYPKVRPGGVIGGDDYTRRDVRQAVHETFQSVETFSEGKIPVWKRFKGHIPHEGL